MNNWEKAWSLKNLWSGEEKSVWAEAAGKSPRRYKRVWLKPGAPNKFSSAAHRFISRHLFKCYSSCRSELSVLDSRTLIGLHQSQWTQPLCLTTLAYFLDSLWLINEIRPLTLRKQLGHRCRPPLWSHRNLLCINSLNSARQRTRLQHTLGTLFVCWQKLLNCERSSSLWSLRAADEPSRLSVAAQRPPLIWVLSHQAAIFLIREQQRGVREGSFVLNTFHISFIKATQKALNRLVMYFVFNFWKLEKCFGFEQLSF